MRNTARTTGWASWRPSRVYYGWWVVAAGSVLYIIFSATYVGGITFYVLPVSTDLGISRTAISTAIGLAWVIGAVQGPIAGYMVDRVGPRYMILAGGALGGLGFIVLAQTHGFPAFVAVFLGMIALGFSGGFDMGVMSTVSRWFTRRSPRAYSLLLVGFPVGSAFFAPLVGLLVIYGGWRTAATVSGAMMLTVLVPAILIIRNLPEDMGLEIDGGDPPASESRGASARVQRAAPEAAVTARQAFRTPTYWLMVLAMSLRIAAFMALMIHLVPIVVWKGQSETAAASLIAVFGVVSIVCRGSMGWISERYSKKRLASLTMLMGALSILVLMASGGALWQLAIYLVFLAMSDSGNVAAWSFFSEQFDRRAFATLFGATTFVYRLFSAGTPILAGYIFDSTGSYFWALVLMLALYSSSGLIFWNIPRLKVG